ncbi:RNA polymerase sigma-70 factor (ECF subfamily) [Pseudoduganella flava]|uniref:RNA polymerase sigma-70 factor (ECF subfamily) n=1 Tax=Pseudoduganella flava TaxID=871742 RepID=A0A562PDU0_9BURK|nr:RNA polymerase sigma factor [Pseudoduganella flava]QGZ42126.1 sigma-70 family RNA polymerase sigma factor [Pseudoduganella flava]TWI42503.1 RNA polymerase sigma-70 factor (ECF subfamily) [Pseudoduganella flava]
MQSTIVEQIHLQAAVPPCAVPALQSVSSQSVPFQAAPQPAIDIVALYRQHRTHLLRFVQRYLGNPHDAEDVVQNTFVEAVRCAPRFSGLSKPSTWLFGIALNLARNQVRRNGADRYEAVEEDFLEQLVDVHADPALQYEWRELAVKVDKLIGELPPKIRDTFEAVLEGELTYEEAAREMGIPIGTVRSRVSRVRAAARQQCGRTD